MKSNDYAYCSGLAKNPNYLGLKRNRGPFDELSLDTCQCDICEGSFEPYGLKGLLVFYLELMYSKYNKNFNPLRDIYQYISIHADGMIKKMTTVEHKKIQDILSHNRDVFCRADKDLNGYWGLSKYNPVAAIEHLKGRKSRDAKRASLRLKKRKKVPLSYKKEEEEEKQEEEEEEEEELPRKKLLLGVKEFHCAEILFGLFNQKVV